MTIQSENAIALVSTALTPLPMLHGFPGTAKPKKVGKRQKKVISIPGKQKLSAQLWHKLRGKGRKAIGIDLCGYNSK